MKRVFGSLRLSKAAENAVQCWNNHQDQENRLRDGLRLAYRQIEAAVARFCRGP
jgi:hypothetical protein